MKTGQISEVIGETPLIELQSLSKLTGCRIFGKAEFLNPGGSVKDRAALGIIREALANGQLKAGMKIFEGTAGNTGIGLATLAPSYGLSCVIVMPNNQAAEKYQTLKALGVELITVDPCPFANPNHFYHTAGRLAAADPQGFWANQFENTANAKAHYETTGPEIWEQVSGVIHHFCAASGTGGTISGVSRYLKEKQLKEKKPDIQITLIDPLGSGMFSYFNTGEIKSEGSSVTEGIGIMRLTANFKSAKIDQAMQITDQQMINMLYHLAEKDGLLVGTSAALNAYGAYQLGLKNKNSGKTIVTVLCDSALRYQSRIFNSEWLAEKKLIPQKLDIT